MNKNLSKWMSLAALFNFAAAVFQITNEKYILSAVFFGAAVCFTAAAGISGKKETEANKE